MLTFSLNSDRLTWYWYWKQSIPQVLFLFRNIKSHHNIVLINLCMALIFANVTFIVGIEWTESKVSKSKQQCFPIIISCLVKYNSILLIQKCKFADYQLFIEYISFLSSNCTVMETEICENDLALTFWILNLILN